MRVQSEYEVESLFLDRLQEMDYKYVDLKNYDDVISNFREQVIKFNADKLIEVKGSASLSDSEFERIVQRLDNHSVYESAKILREKWVLPLDDGKTVYISFLSDDETRNTFQVSHQITMDKEHKGDVEYKNRYDVTILINGLPLVQIELKRPGIEINEAINQINRYRRYSFKGLFRYIQIFVVSNSTQTKYFANVNERNQDSSIQNILKSLVFYWTDAENKRINKLIDFTNSFLTRFNITQMLNKYFVIKESEPVLMVMRPYQIYAVDLAYQRVINAGMNGYVFACTGSGKTLSSFKLATMLRDNRSVEKVIFLVDRKDLDDQTIEEYNSFEAGCVDMTDNTATLVHDLKDSSKSLLVTTIQKMANAVKNPKYADVIAPYLTKKVVFIIDECHRSQFGKMHGEIRKFFQKANYIGFTGTPIFKENKNAGGRTTADVFATGSDKVDPCIHRYMIKEAIADGNVLPFSVEYMRSINVLHAENPDLDVTRLDDPDYCKEKKVDMDSMYHNQKRIESIADHIMKHLDQYTRPQGKDIYTALFAVDKISTLTRYYDYLKNHNPNNYKIAAIFTFQANEDVEDEGVDELSGKQLENCMKDYNDLFDTHYDLSSFDAYRNDISKRMKQKDLPQVDLLLVVNMFLTGFDSKPTNTLLLDKNLIWHSLVQAYSRTNRVHKITKQFGKIVTYRNIKRAQDDALKLFSGDGNPDEYLIENYETFVDKYKNNVEALRRIVPTPDDAGNLQSEDVMKEFVLAFRKIVGNLAILKTFSKFDWEDLDPYLDEQEYSDYKSWYLSIYDKIKRQEDSKKTSILADIDFEISLVRTDKINVIYILNLIKDALKKDNEKREQAMDLIIREIERSDNEKLRFKKDILKEFIQSYVLTLDPNDDIILAYEQFEREKLEKDVRYFSEENNLNENMVSDVLMNYFVHPKSVTTDNLRSTVSTMGYGLVKTLDIVDSILKFVSDMYDKYTTEEE